MSISLSSLSPAKGATKRRTRVGRGHGSGRGETSGKGIKGQKARTGHHGARIGFEGGQMPMQRRLPKRGFKNAGRVEYYPVNLGDLDERFASGATVDVTSLVAAGLVPRKAKRIKVLGSGELTRPLMFNVQACSEAALKKIESIGGKMKIAEVAATPTVSST